MKKKNLPNLSTMSTIKQTKLLDIVKRKKQQIEANYKMTQMLLLTDKNFKAVITNMLKSLRKRKTMNKEMGKYQQRNKKW